IEKQHQRDVWMSATYVNQLARKRQIQRADQIVRAVVAQQVCVDGDALAALKEKADHRPIETWRLDRLTIADMQFDPRDWSDHRARSGVPQRDFKMRSEVTDHIGNMKPPQPADKADEIIRQETERIGRFQIVESTYVWKAGAFRVR